MVAEVVQQNLMEEEIIIMQGGEGGVAVALHQSNHHLTNEIQIREGRKSHQIKRRRRRTVVVVVKGNHNPRPQSIN